MKKLVLSFAAVAMLATAAFAGKGNLLASDENSTFSSSLNMKKKKGGDAFGEGASVVSAGYGFPNLGKSVLKAFESEANYKVGGIGPMHLKYEYGLSDKVGIGLSLNYVSFSATWTESYTESQYDSNGNYIGEQTVTYDYKTAVSSISALVRMNVHFATTDKLDPYWGIGVGYRTYSWKFTSTDPYWVDSGLKSAIPVGFESTVGMRYYFTDNIGAYLEFGAAKSLMQGGIAAKF